VRLQQSGSLFSHFWKKRRPPKPWLPVQDTDGNGHISLEELRRGLEAMGSNMDLSTVQARFPGIGEGCSLSTHRCGLSCVGKHDRYFIFFLNASGVLGIGSEGAKFQIPFHSCCL
jgi:hypothetical protein